MTALFLALARKFWLPAVAVVGFAGGVAWWNHSERAIGAERERNAALTASLASTAARVDTLRLAARVDTVRLVRYVARWDTAFAEILQHDTVTLARTDTVRVPAATLMLADSTIQACGQVMRDCSARFAAESTLALGWEQKARAVAGEQPSGFARLVGALRWVALGAAGGYVASRIH